MTPCGGMMDVGNGLLYPALRKAGVTLGPGRTPSDAQFQDAIDELNRLVGSLNCDRLFIYAQDTLRLPILTGDGAWTIGPDPTADFNQARPQAITQAMLIDDETNRIELVLATEEVWAAGAVESTDDGVVSGASSVGWGCGCESNPPMLFYNNAFPVATIFLRTWIANARTLELWVWHLVPRFTSVSNGVLLPPGYEDAITLNLAVRLGPQFQRAVDPTLRLDARESLMRLESINAPKPIAVFPSLGGGCGGCC
jgi:hypothetical protein